MPLGNNPAGARRNALRKAKALLEAKKEEQALKRKRQRRKEKRETGKIKHRERPPTKLDAPKPQTEEEMREFARSYAERYVEYSDDADADTIYDEWFTLAFDGLVKVGIDHATARNVAQYVATCVAQP